MGRSPASPSSTGGVLWMDLHPWHRDFPAASVLAKSWLWEYWMQGTPCGPGSGILT